MKGPGVESRVS